MADVATRLAESRLATLRGWRRVALLVGVALVVRVVLLLIVRGDPVAGDAAVTVDLATRLAGGAGYAGVVPQVELHPTAVAVPAQPFLVGIVLEVLGPSVTVARLVNLVVGLGVVLAVDLLGRRVAATVVGWDRVAASLTGLTAGVAVALHPGLGARDVVPVSAPLFALVVVAMLVLVLDGRTFAAAVAAGLAILVRPEAVVLAAVVFGWVGLRQEWRRAGWFLLLSAVVVFPWLLRNSIVLDTPLLTSNTGRVLVALYSDEAHETGIGVDATTDPRFDDLALTRFDEAAWDRALRERALYDLGADPRRVVVVAGRNAVAQLGVLVEEQRVADERDGVPRPVSVAAMVLWPLLAVAGAVGLVQRRRARGAELVGVAAITLLATNLVLVVATPTARAPVEVLACVGLGLLVASAVRSRSAATATA